jgi:mRNA interferase RelE/StbE
VYTVDYTRQALKTLSKLPQNIASQIRKKITEIAEDPYAQHGNVSKLQNRAGYRLRIGDWRVIYNIDKGKTIIIVIKIGTRGEVYR